MAMVELKSEVTGSVWKIEMQPSGSARARRHVMIIESMKMEIPVIAEDGGTLNGILGEEGERRHRRPGRSRFSET